MYSLVSIVGYFSKISKNFRYCPEVQFAQKKYTRFFWVFIALGIYKFGTTLVFGHLWGEMQIGLWCCQNKWVLSWNSASPGRSHFLLHFPQLILQIEGLWILRLGMCKNSQNANFSFSKNKGFKKLQNISNKLFQCNINNCEVILDLTCHMF